jgi:nitronate monooxygenase
MNFESGQAAETAKAWRDIWGAGQGVGAIEDILSAAEVILRMRREYLAAKAELTKA